MKRISIIIMALLSIVVMDSFVFMKNGKETGSLESLWRKFEKASDEDRVRDMADLLEDIKAVALRKKSPVDYFRACDDYVNVKSRMNWKLTDSLISQGSRELHEYGLPVLEALFDLRHGADDDSVKAFISSNGAVLKKTKTEELYRNVMLFNSFDDYFNLIRFHTVENDYEYILWMAGHYRGLGGGWPYGMLEEYYGNEYPAGPYVRFLKAKSGFDGEEIVAEMKKIAEEYSGRGIGMLAEDELFGFRFGELGSDASSEEYLRLRDDIRDFDRRCSGLRGDDAVLAGFCLTASDVLEQLERKRAGVIVDDGDAYAVLRNIDKAVLAVKKDDETVFETDVVNAVGSFYKADTVKVDIPELNDGDYRITLSRGKETLCATLYEKYTLSVANRLAADGMCIYAADYLTGEPVEKADLLLYEGKAMVAEFKGFVFDGFTELPEEIYPFGEKRGCRLVCRSEKDGRVRMSKPMYLDNRLLLPGRTKSILRAAIVKDRAAFVPGDTVRFKVFMFVEEPDGAKATVPAGEDVLAYVEDPNGNVVSRMKLVTNEFGSASGSFTVGAKGRNGRWKIWLDNVNCEVAPSYFTVDEFVLPSYDLSFDNQEKLYFPGDEVKVTGKITSWSGHGLAGLKASASVTVNFGPAEVKPVDIASDGSFELSLVAGCPDDEYVNLGVEVRLTDNTGETLEFNWNSFVSKSINLNATLLNGDNGSFEPVRDNKGSRYMFADNILSASAAEIECVVSGRGLAVPDIPVEYELSFGGKPVRSGCVKSGTTLSLDMSGLAPGLYRFEMKASFSAPGGGNVTSSKNVDIFYMPKDEDVMPSCGLDRMFRTSYKDGNITMQLGSGAGPVWAVVELFGKGCLPLEKKIVHLDGRAGESGSLETLVFPHRDEYSDKLFLGVLYFRNGEGIQYQETFVRPKDERRIPLEFSSFVDRALPGQEVSLTMKTLPDTEVLVSVFDASSQKISFNTWDWLHGTAATYPVEVHYSHSVGSDGTGGYPYAVGYGTGRKSLRVGKAVTAMNAMAFDSTADAIEEEAVLQRVETGSPYMDAAIRDDFAATLAFEPFLRPSADGTVEMKFRTSDKLSAFIVKVMAHDKSMNTAFADREMVVTLPVRLSLMAPQYLYAGDKYVLNASVSNTSGTVLKGRVHLEVYDGGKYVDVKPLKAESADVEVPAGGSVPVGFEIDVPGLVDSLGFKAVFVGHECASEGIAVHDVLVSDGMFVPVPVRPAAQVLTESHSAVLLGGGSADELVSRLRDEFVNVSSAGAEYSEISIMDMIYEALPVAYESGSEDAVSLSEAMFVNFLAADLHAGDGAEVRKCVEAAMGAVSKLLACANDDGGFAWIDGMPSSPVVTALVLERYAGLSDRRLLDVAQHVWGQDSLDDLDSAILEAVKYLDSSYFGDPERPAWYGGLSLGQYLNVRSMFAGVAFDEAAVRKSMGRKGYKEFQKAVRKYLKPDSWAPGRVLEKVRAIRLIDILSQEGCRDLAKAWGVNVGKKMRGFRDAEVQSLRQYAVEHPSGGLYYPNAVMPWRGLMESEAYAHAQICNLASELAASDGRWNEVADGVRIWLMLQKETQKWTSDPGFVEALASVCDGSERVKDTKVIILSKRYEKPFDEIKAAGNGFRVSVDYYKAGVGGASESLAEGDSLHVGDKVTAVYSLWSGENRSHVRLSVPRAACFRPVEQLSGWSGGWFRTVSYGPRLVSPYSYREVKADRTLYWIDVFPEEDTVIKEELFVTQEGTFTAPAAEIESLYAPHYRANAGFGGQATVR